MKTLQKYFSFGLLLTAGLVFAGCGDTATDTAPTPSTDSAPAEGSGDKTDATDATSENSPADTSQMHLVSLNVPNMT